MTDHISLNAWCEELATALGLDQEAATKPAIQLLLDVSCDAIAQSEA